MRAYINRATKISDKQFDDMMERERTTNVKCKSKLKRRILRGFKKSARQKYKTESEG